MKKHIFSVIYIYKLVLPKPTNSQNEESRTVSAVHSLVKRRSSRLFSFSSCRYFALTIPKRPATATESVFLQKPLLLGQLK